MIKDYKFEIVKPVDMSWDVLNKLLMDFRYITYKIMNISTVMYWDYMNTDIGYRKRTGHYIDIYDVVGKKRYDSVIYEYIKKHFFSYGSCSNIMNIPVVNAVKTIKNYRNAILSGEMTMPTYKKGMPINIRATDIRPVEEDECYLSILGLEKAKELNRTGRMKQAVRVKIKKKGNQKIIWNRILSGEYTIRDSKISKNNGKWFLNLSYEIKKFKQYPLNKSKVLGIDLGIVNAATLAVSNSPVIYYIRGGEISSLRRQMEARKKERLNHLKYASENNSGHGKKHKLRAVKYWRNKVSNARNNINHKYAKYIVNKAIANGCGTIQMEDLTEIHNKSKGDKFLSNWSYFDLQQKITFKSQEAGIDIKYVNPRYTSLRCSQCGNIDTENRTSQQTFKCIKCGYKRNADVNAAKNIAIINIDDIISKQLKSKKEVIKKKKTLKRKLENKPTKTVEPQKESKYEQIKLDI